MHRLQVDPRNPAPYCGPCKAKPHGRCEGWLDGFCACFEDACFTDLTIAEEEQA